MRSNIFNLYAIKSKEMKPTEDLKHDHQAIETVLRILTKISDTQSNAATAYLSLVAFFKILFIFTNIDGTSSLGQ